MEVHEHERNLTNVIRNVTKPNVVISDDDRSFDLHLHNTSYCSFSNVLSLPVPFKSTVLTSFCLICFPFSSSKRRNIRGRAYLHYCSCSREEPTKLKKNQKTQKKKKRVKSGSRYRQQAHKLGRMNQYQKHR